MTDYQTSHYDIDHEQRGKTLMVLDSFRMMAEAVDNDVIPASREDVVISGIENPASTLRSNGNIYTTLPLRPVSKDVNFMFQNYVHHDFKLNITATADPAPATDVDFAIYAPCVASLPSRLQLMNGNTSVWQNQFQRAEAMAAMASVPQEIVQTCPEYVTMSKLENREPIPGGYVTWKAGETQQTFTINLDANADINHLTPLLSNIPFTTTETGDLRLRPFYEKLDEALCITPLPSKEYNGSKFTLSNFHVLERLPLTKPVKFMTDTQQPLATSANNIGASTAGTKSTFTFTLQSWEANNAGVEIVQSNFSIKESSREGLKKYIGEDNKLVIPTQTWSTCLSTSVPNGTTTQELIFQVSAYNIYLLAFLFPFNSTWQTYYPHPKMYNIDIMLNSKSVNYIPYNYVDTRVVKDTIQAFLNDDKYGANENLVNSLILAPYTGTPYDKTAYASVYADKGGPLIHRPNNFCIAKGLSPPNSFEKGYCVASSNPQSTQVRFKYSLGENIDAGIDQLNPGPIYATNYQAYCLALQDCCVVLTYNPTVGTCQAGEVVYAEPFVA